MLQSVSQPAMIAAEWMEKLAFENVSIVLVERKDLAEWRSLDTDEDWILMY